MKLPQSVKSLLKFAFAAALIVYLIQRGHLDPNQLKVLVAPEPLFYGFFLVGMTILLQSWRWYLLLLCRGFATSFFQATKLFLVGVFFNYALPGSIGGDVVKAYYIVQNHRERRVDAVLTVVLDRLLGLYAMLAMALITIIINWAKISSDVQLQTLALGAAGIFALMTLFWAAAFSRRLSRWLSVEHWLERLPLGQKLLSLYRATQAYGGQKMILLTTLFLSLLAQLVTTGFMIMVGHYTGHSDVTLGTYFFAVPLGFIAASLPIAPAGLGVGQVAFLVLFQMYSGHPSQLGQIAVTAFQAVLLGWGLLGALFYLKGPSLNANAVVETT